MEGKWLIADRDLNEREGLKWLLKSSSIAVSSIFLAANYQEFVVLFERETPDVVLIELDMISREEWSTFKGLVQIYEPILILTSAEATFEKARLAIDLQALDLLIKPFSTTKVNSVFQKASKKQTVKLRPQGSHLHSNIYNELSYESLFVPQASGSENCHIAALRTENGENIGTLYSYLTEYPFNDLLGTFPLSDMVILLFKETCSSINEQCQKVMRRWDEEFSEPLAICVHLGESPSITINQKYVQVRKMLEFTYYKGYRQVMEFEFLPDWIHIDPFLTPPEQREWVEMLKSKDLEKIKKWLYQEFLQWQGPFPDPGLVRIRLTSILAQIRRYMKTYHLDDEQSFEKEYRHIFHSILYDTVLYRTVQNLILFIQRIFIGVESSIRNFKQDPVERGISFMEENFSNSQLRLEDVARFVDRNPSYFSHLLASKTGSNFTDVLSGIRIKEAKRLLTESNKSVKEVSNLAGFHNTNYFSRMFKEQTGMSPREFRMQKGSD
ncbi:helix-turn-helix domain-containing protein [Bacillus sp. BRMEA1]|uniref:helix-turn-helix domain-containing protein n=1 Tax=Neobacillus endophyticus TaxID=2738405 RepID=UPI001566B5A7|nr:helix-turn-helix domain-containing protein [Neobacillus endophyticus]NRD79439.1 helix-turn-helix domain-containing protein [Neobacillus endophyticus]